MNKRNFDRKLSTFFLCFFFSLFLFFVMGVGLAPLNFFIDYWGFRMIEMLMMDGM